MLSMLFNKEKGNKKQKQKILMDKSLARTTARRTTGAQGRGMTPDPRGRDKPRTQPQRGDGVKIVLREDVPGWCSWKLCKQQKQPKRGVVEYNRKLKGRSH